VVGCEPATLGDEEDLPAEMSPAVQAAVIVAIPLIESLVGKLLCTNDLILEKEVPSCHPHEQTA
jgi:hypothetical protein